MVYAETIGETAVGVLLFLQPLQSLVDVPVAPMDTEGVVRGLCLERANEMFVHLIVLTDQSTERWRIIDKGGDALALERTELFEDADGLASCAPRGREIIGVEPGGVTRPIIDPAWGFSNGSDVAGLENIDGLWTIVTRPDEPAASLVGPNTKDVALTFVDGLNAPAIASPALVAASDANYGGSYSSGVLLIAKDDAVNVVELGGALSAAITVLRADS